MKKVLFVCAFAASLLLSNTTDAQQKIGYFDDQVVLLWHPGLQEKLETAMRSYMTDSLGVDYNYTYGEFVRKDSAYKKDSAAMPARAREMAIKDLVSLRDKLSNWQEYARQMSEAKQESILMPYKIKIADALKAVVAEGHYTMVLNQAALTNYVLPPLSDNLNIKVAQKLKLTVPKEYEDIWKQAAAATPASSPASGGAPKKQ